ncbi:MAG: hypothetical protein KC464_35370, partial [Myxococcales bacterium]|nr:hypothetical protein [Myxococcales bacterium]
YVHVAERSRREIPETILRAAENKSDPNHRVVAMLGARAKNRPNFGWLSRAGEGIRSFEKPNGLAILHVILEASRPLKRTGSHCWEPVLDRRCQIWRAETAERGDD